MAHIILRANSSSFVKAVFFSVKKPQLLIKASILGGTRCFQNGGDTGFWDIEGSTAVTPSQTKNQNKNLSRVVQLPNVDKTASFESDSVRVTAFGHIRLDTENTAKEPAPEQSFMNPAEPLNYVDEQFFGIQKGNNQLQQDKSHIKASEVPTDTNEIDSQYFYPNKLEDGMKEKQKTTTKTDSTSATTNLEFEKDTIDDQYFGEAAFVNPLEEKRISALEHIQLSMNENKPFTNNYDKNVGEPTKSYQRLIPDFRKLPIEDICSILKKSIIYNEGGIVAINKPFGMVTTDVDKTAKLILTDFLPKLSQLLRYEKLYTVHRLDRDTTGVLLLASNQEMANKLNKQFLSKEIKKVYVAITKGIPNPKEGTINIPISETTVMNRQRMKLRPVQPHDQTQIESSNFKGKSSKAITHYKVLRFKGSAALVQLEPETGARHQIRVHLSEAIQCPILGDHKYSHQDKYAPQKLPDDLLRNLNLSPTKTRTIPMHLHAESIHIPNMGSDGRDLVILAPMPQYFHYTLKKLKLSSKRK